MALPGSEAGDLVGGDLDLVVVAFTAVGGWAVQRRASAQGGAVILGLLGSVSAALFAGLTYGAEKELVLLCAAAGLAYGSIGGMLIAIALGENKNATSG